MPNKHRCTRAHTHLHTAEDGPASPGGLSQIGCQILETAALITAFMNTLPFMFIQTLIYLPQEIKRDRHSLTGPLENWNFRREKK